MFGGYRYKWKCPVCKRRVSASTQDGLQRVIGLHYDTYHGGR